MVIEFALQSQSLCMTCHLKKIMPTEAPCQAIKNMNIYSDYWVF